MATEKRLIDVNKVIYQMQKCIDESPYERDSIASYTFGAIIECLKKEPTVDAVEVIRCKDCKYWKPGDSKGGNSIEDLQVIGGCKWTICCRRERDFCSFAERKDND